MAHITLAEWRRVSIFALVITALTVLPYLIGWISAGETWEFNGFVIGAEDGNAYLGKMRLGARGEWEFYLFYSPEETDSAFGLYLPYIAIGQVTGLFIAETSPELVTVLAVAFQMFRIFASVLLILAIYCFIAEFLISPATRWFALLIATLGGGLGWILVLLGQMQPVEFYIPEGFTFLVILGLPHVALARASILIGLIFLFRALKHQCWQDAVIAGLLWNIVGLMVTFYLIVVYAIAGAWGLALWIKYRRFPVKYTLMGGIAAGLTLPLFLYNIWLFSMNEAFSQWSGQNYLPSPNPLHYLSSYGVLAFFAFIGGKWAWKKEEAKYLLLPAWVLIVPILVYLPVNVQRRLAEAFFIPLVILSVAGLKLLTQHLKLYRLTRKLVLIAILPTMLLLLVGTLFAMTVPDYPAFRAKAETDAMDWLARYAESDSRVMASFDTGNYLPARTNLRPFLGHGPETLYLDEKKDTVEQFYRGELSPMELQQLFTDFNMRYVMFGPLERKINPDASGWNDGLELIYEKNGYQIYEVVR